MIHDAVKGVAADSVATASGTAAVITYGAISQPSGSAPGGPVPAIHVIAAVYWSYDAAPTGGNLTIKDGATVIFSADISAAGPGFFEFSPHKAGTTGNSMTITLADGGVNQKINATHYVQA